ncbi:hypothetical protein ADUPG1_009325, partial [Aduncisulcus paluster]
PMKPSLNPSVTHTTNVKSVTTQVAETARSGRIPIVITGDYTKAMFKYLRTYTHTAVVINSGLSCVPNEYITVFGKDIHPLCAAPASKTKASRRKSHVLKGGMLLEAPFALLLGFLPRPQYDVVVGSLGIKGDEKRRVEEKVKRYSHSIRSIKFTDQAEREQQGREIEDTDLHSEKDTVKMLHSSASLDSEASNRTELQLLQQHTQQHTQHSPPKHRTDGICGTFRRDENPQLFKDLGTTFKALLDLFKQTDVLTKDDIIYVIGPDNIHTFCGLEQKDIDEIGCSVIVYRGEKASFSSKVNFFIETRLVQSEKEGCLEIVPVTKAKMHSLQALGAVGGNGLIIPLIRDDIVSERG